MYVLSRYSVFSMSETHSSRETLCKCGSFQSKFTTKSVINRCYFDKFSIPLFLRSSERIKAAFIIEMHLETIGYHIFKIMIEKSIFINFLPLLCQSRNDRSLYTMISNPVVLDFSEFLLRVTSTEFYRILGRGLIKTQQ